MDSTTVALIELAKSFGVAFPLVAALIYLLRASEQRAVVNATERKETGDRYMNALTTVVSDTRVVMEKITDAMTEEITTSREARAHAREEHRAIIDAVHDSNRAVLDAIGKVQAAGGRE